MTNCFAIIADRLYRLLINRLEIRQIDQGEWNKLRILRRLINEIELECYPTE